MSAEFDAALEVCGKLEEIRQELECLQAGLNPSLANRRERIATAALQLFRGNIKDGSNGKPDCSTVAKLALACADALIEALDADKPNV